MRTDGYAPIADYALVGDGRTAALVSRDGSIDWLCTPNFDSPSVFASLLDARGGGSFVMQPAIPFSASRRYLPCTNVLETTFTTDRGAVRVVDAMTLPDARLAPMRDVVRSVEGLSGTVPMRWACTPRFDYGRRTPRPEQRGRVPIATWATEAVAVCSWEAGTAAWRGDEIAGSFELRDGAQADFVLALAHAEPLVFPGRSAARRRLDRTIAFWRDWAGRLSCGGPWCDAVRRSALVLKLLIFSPSGATTAAPTTSLPEEIGGERNWDYRFCWIRDSNFTIDALLELGCHDEAKALFWWFLQATARTEPELHVLYRLDGGLGLPEFNLPLAGYRGSAPVRLGNGAVEQMQLDIYGDLLQTAWLYSEGHQRLDSDTGATMARIVDHVCRIWCRKDAGIWEVRSAPQHFTHSKVMCWAALDRAIRLAERGELPSARLDAWRAERHVIAAFVDERCWSDRLGAYTRSAGSDLMDASLLMLPIVEFGLNRPERLHGTIDAVMRELQHGDFVYRYKADDGLSGTEGCFLNCSFWLVDALARVGRLAEAEALMERLVGRANDLGLYAEEIDPASGEFLGNFPQALVHLGLINAAVSIETAKQARADAERRSA